MAKRVGKVWTAGTGWVQKKETQSANYDHLGEGWAFLISFCRWFPDMVLDLLRSETADYDLSIIQRVMMRAKARHQYCDITGGRGVTKTYSTTNEEYVEMLLWPGIKLAYYGPAYQQMAKIGSETFRQIEKDYPALAAHFTVEAESKDRFQLTTPYGSCFAITAFRGDNTHKVVAEEYAQEENPPFDVEDYKRVVLPAVRLEYKDAGKRNRTYIPFKQHSITSAGRRQNHSFDTRERHMRMMARGESAFVMDIPFDVVLLSQMRSIAWANTLRGELTPEQWMREMEAFYTGSEENPIVSDATLTESRCLLRMEEHHCCRDRDNKLKPEDVIYIIGYDVSYADGEKNAKCAVVVLKCTKQDNWMKRDKYLKQIVWVDDWAPMDDRAQARRLKTVWSRFCFEGSESYIAIDAWQYGFAVLQALMTDLEDGLAPLCIYKHESLTENELDGAVPVIYPIKAGGVGVTDPDSEMVRNAETQFANRNVQLLTRKFDEGIAAYKTYHRIKDDRSDYLLYKPYKKTTELVGQIQNLKKVPSGAGVSERRISRHIQRDSWSACKYALRFAQLLERTYLMRRKKKSEWDALLRDAAKNGNRLTGTDGAGGRMVVPRLGGRQL